MAGILLIIGITLFVVGTMVLANDASGSGRSWLTILLPFASMGYVREHWSAVWPAAVLRVIGLSVLLAGLGVFVAQRPFLLKDDTAGHSFSSALKGSKHYGPGYINDAEVAILANALALEDSALSGQVLDRQFVTTRAELINGVLSIQHGQGFIPELEFRILTGIDEKAIKERVDLYVTLKDAEAPEIQFTINDENSNLPETAIFKSGYSMELQLAPLSEKQLKGYLKIILPREKNSYLVGEFVANINHLRYQHDSVDLTFNHVDTLEHVAEQYLKNQYPGQVLEGIEFLLTEMKLGSNTGTSIVRAHLQGGRVVEKRLQLERADIGWALRPGGVETMTVVASQKINNTSPSVEEVPPSVPPSEINFSELEEFTGQQIMITDTRGEMLTGKLIAVRRSVLQLEKSVSSGLVQYSVAEEDISALQLGSGRVIQLRDESAVADVEAVLSTEVEKTLTATTPVIVTTDVEVTVAEERETGAEESVTGEEEKGEGADITTQPGQPTRYAPLVGQRVVITGIDGKSRTGILRAADKIKLTLAVRVEAGVLEYFYAPSEITSVTEAPDQ